MTRSGAPSPRRSLRPGRPRRLRERGPRRGSRRARGGAGGRLGVLPRPDEVPSPRAGWSMQRKCRGASPRPKDFSWENSLSGQAERVPRGSSRSVDLCAWRGQRLVAARRGVGQSHIPVVSTEARKGRAERPSLHDKPLIVEARSLRCAWSLPRAKSRGAPVETTVLAVFRSEHVPIGTGATLQSAYEFYCPRSTSGGLSHETQSTLGLCSVVVPAVVPCGTQRAPVAQPVETKGPLRLRPIQGARRHPAAVRISDCSLSLMVSPA